jgi:hypothetical protein
MISILNSNKTFTLFSLMIFATLLFASCRQPSDNSKRTDLVPSLAGAWKEKVQFQTGAFAEIQDLEFMFVFNAGGTMTESSNYDAAPPVPPAYGIWRHVGGEEFEAKYEFYVTRIPSPAESKSSSGGWLPAGHGVLKEKITLSPDGNSFTSTILYEVFDQPGKPTTGGGEAKGQGIRLQF